MKNRWIVTIGVVLLLGGLVATAAAHRERRMRDPGPRDFLQHLNLSDEQKKQFKELRYEHGQKVRVLRDTRAAPGDFEALHVEHRTAMRTILTEEQWEKMESLHENSVGRFHGGPMRGDRGPEGWRGDLGRGVEDVFAPLKLTEEQRQALSELRQIHREELRQLHKGHRAAMEEILTDTQREKLGELKDRAFYGDQRRDRRSRW